MSQVPRGNCGINVLTANSGGCAQSRSAKDRYEGRLDPIQDFQMVGSHPVVPEGGQAVWCVEADEPRSHTTSAEIELGTRRHYGQTNREQIETSRPYEQRSLVNDLTHATRKSQYPLRGALDKDSKIDRRYGAASERGRVPNRVYFPLVQLPNDRYLEVQMTGRWIHRTNGA